MKELLYSGLILGGLAGIVGCDKSAEGIRKQNIMKSLSYGDPVAKYRTVQGKEKIVTSKVKFEEN